MFLLLLSSLDLRARAFVVVYVLCRMRAFFYLNSLSLSRGSLARFFKRKTGGGHGEPTRTSLGFC